MDRRAFLGAGLVAGAVVALPGSMRVVWLGGEGRRRMRSSAPLPRSRRVSPWPVAVRELADRVVFSNEVGDWHVWTQLAWSGDGQRIVGPGYIGRLERRDGVAQLVDDFRAPGTVD